MTSTQQTALITGASGGIGYELSKLFAADGYNLVLVARSGPKLAELATELQTRHGVTVTTLVYDLSDPACPQAVFDAVQARNLTIDVLVNNAGYGLQGNFHAADLAAQLNMLQLNVVSLTHLTGLFLPGMVQRRQGKILNVGSTGSFEPVPFMAVYGATKAYVLSFSESLAEELRGTGVSVTALCPGFTLTGFKERANLADDAIMVRLGGMSAQAVAQSGYKALLRRSAVIIPGLFNQLMIFSVRFTPRRLVRRLARYVIA